MIDRARCVFCGKLFDSIGPYDDFCSDPCEEQFLSQNESEAIDPLDDDRDPTNPVECSAETWAGLFHDNPDLWELDQTP